MSNKTSSEYSEQSGKQLYDIVHRFIKKQKVSCPESVYQQDNVIENGYELIEELCNVVGYYNWENEEVENDK